jgi:hypothetical protein
MHKAKTGAYDMVRNGHNVSICIWYEMVIMYFLIWYEMAMVRKWFSLRYEMAATKWLWYEMTVILMHESECYFLLHLLHQNSCLVFVKKHSPLFSSWIVSLLTSLFTEWISSNNHLEMFFSWGIWFSLPTCKLPEPTWIVCLVFR